MGQQETQTQNELREIESSTTVLLPEEYYQKGKSFISQLITLM